MVEIAEFLNESNMLGKSRIMYNMLMKALPDVGRGYQWHLRSNQLSYQ